METQLLEQTDTEAEYKTAIKELALTDNASGYLYLREGKMAVAFNSLDTADFALPLTVTHVHKMGGTETVYGQNWRLNINKKLKLNFDDTEKNTRYVYTDELGDTHVFSEEYFYVEGGVQKPIEDKSQIIIDGNGKLTYNGKQVYKKQYCKGYTLIPEINDYKGCELIEQRVDERIELEEYVLKTEPELKGYVRVNAASGAPSDSDVGFTAAVSLTKESCEAFLDGVTADSDDIIIKETELSKWSAETKQALISTARKNLGKVKYEFIKYFKKKAELDLLLLNTPVCYLKDGSGIISGFNSDGDLVCIIDAYGRYLAINYGAGGRINSIYDSNGTAAEFAYDNNLLKSITDKFGRKVSFTYTQNLLTSVSFADGSAISFSYTANQISTVKSSNCQQTTLTYNSGKLTSMSRESTSPRYGVIEYINITYQSNGITFAKDGEREIYTFTTNGRVASHEIEEPTKMHTTVTYTYSDTANGYSVTATTSDNTGGQSITVRREYNKAEKINKEVTGKKKINNFTTVNTETFYTYDDNDRLIQKRHAKYIEVIYDPDDDSSGYSVLNYMEKYKYDIYGNLVLTESYVMGEEKTSGINYEERVYNDSGIMVKCIRWNSLDSSSKFYEEYETEKDGRVKYEKDETGAYSAMYDYVDGKNIVNSVTYANGGKTAYGRNPYNNQVTSVTASTADGEANTNEIEYKYGLPAKVTSGNTSIEYSYDHKGRKTAVVVNGATQWTCSYDDVNDFDDDDMFTFGYNTKRIYTGSGDISIATSKYTIDAGEDVAHVKENVSINGTGFSTEYNGAGLMKMQSYKDADGNQRYTNYSYDSCNNLKRIETKSQAVGGETLSTESYEYDDFGALRVRKISGAVEHAYYYIRKYNGAHDLDYVTFGGYSFKPLTDVNGRNTGREITKVYTKIAGEYITYRKVGDHATNMPATVWFASGSQIKDSIKYKYDSCGNISEITENGHLVARYTYDALNRLIREDNKPLDKTVIFTYDSAGNITERCEYGFTLFSEESLAAQECTHINYDYEGDKLISYNGAKCVYNNIGNPLIYRGKVCEWQYGNRLTKCGEKIFKYDSLGRRTNKGIIAFTYDSDGRIIKQSNGFEFFYDANGVAGFKYKGATYFYRKDAQGNIIAILNKDGIAIIKYYYDAWGNSKTLFLMAIGATDKYVDAPAPLINDDAELWQDIALYNPFRYRSYYYDIDADLYYLQSRYYDPEVGRFISQDSIEYADPETVNGLNLFAYCGNNPVMNVDPTGTSFLVALFIGALIAGLLAGTVNAVSAAHNGESAKSCVGAFLGGFITGSVLGAAAILGGGLAVGAITATASAVAGIGAFLTFGTFAAGALSYYAENLIKGDPLSSDGAFKNGLITFGQGLLSFGFGFVMGKLGLFDYLKPGNGLGDIVRSTNDLARMEIGKASFRSFARGITNYFSENFTSIILQSFIKAIFVSPWNGLKP